MCIRDRISDIKKHIEEVEKLYRDIRSMRHDMGNHIQTLEHLVAHNNMDDDIVTKALVFRNMSAEKVWLQYGLYAVSYTHLGHSDISVTMNVYTHIGFDDAEEELKRTEEFRKAQAEVEQKKEKPMSQKMFKVV